MKLIIHENDKGKFFIYKSNIVCFVLIALSYSFSHSQDKTYVAPDVNIISVTPVQGSGLNIDRVPGKVQSINRQQVGKKKSKHFGEQISWQTFKNRKDQTVGQQKQISWSKH